MANQISRRQTFDYLAALEPRLSALHAEAAIVDGSSPHFCANRICYRRFKPVIERLVGYAAQHPLLRSEKAYDVAYEAIYDQLPDCQHTPNLSCL